jgi:hypothetical protein
MSTTAVTDSASAAEREVTSLDDGIKTGFLPDDPHYRLTGEFKKEEASAASEQEELPATPGDKGDDKTAAASETAHPQIEEKKGKTAASSESRWAKITRENRELREKLAARETPEPQRDTPQASQPAAEASGRPEPKIDEVDPKTGKAKYTTYDDYQRELRKWDREEALREFQTTSAKTAKERELQHAEQVLKEGFNKKLETGRTQHVDFDQVALNPDLIIPRGSVVDGFLLDSDHAGEVLYHLGQHPEILEGFYGNHDPKTGKYVNKVTPFAQARALTKIEEQFDKSVSSSAKPVTQAPRPAHQVSGNGTVVKDAVAQAVDDQDQETYMREANARELARRKRK